MSAAAFHSHHGTLTTWKPDSRSCRNFIASAGSRLMGTLGTAFGITALLLMYGGDDAGPVFQRAYLAAAGFAFLSLAAAWMMQDEEQEGACPDAIRSA